MKGSLACFGVFFYESFLAIPSILSLFVFTFIQPTLNPIQKKISSQHMNGKISESVCPFPAWCNVYWWCLDFEWSTFQIKERSITIGKNLLLLFTQQICQLNLKSNRAKSQKRFSFWLTNGTNKQGCLSLSSLSSLMKCLLVRLSSERAMIKLWEISIRIFVQLFFLPME